MRILPKGIRRIITAAGIGLAVAAIMQQLRRPPGDRTWHGEVVGVPYDFRPPTLARMRQNWWNPDNPALFTPHTFGVGWSINLYRLLHLNDS